MALKKTLLRKETASKNGKSWAVLVFSGKEPGTESRQNVFDAELAAKFTTPGEYEVEMVKQDKYWNLKSYVSGPVGGAPVNGNAVAKPQAVQSNPKLEIVRHALIATGSIMHGKGSINGSEAENVEAAVASMFRSLVAAAMTQLVEPQ